MSFWCIVRGNRVYRCEKQLAHKENDTESNAKLHEIDRSLLTPANRVALSAKLAGNAGDLIPVAGMLLCAQRYAEIGMKETSGCSVG